MTTLNQELCASYGCLCCELQTHTLRHVLHITLFYSGLIKFCFKEITLIVGRILMVTVCHSIPITFIFMTLLLMQGKTENLTDTMVELDFNLRNYFHYEYAIVTIIQHQRKRSRVFLDNLYFLSHRLWWSQMKDQNSDIQFSSFYAFCLFFYEYERKKFSGIKCFIEGRIGKMYYYLLEISHQST